MRNFPQEHPSITHKRGKQKRQLWLILTVVFLGFIGISMPYLIFPALFLNPEYAILPPDVSMSVRALLLGVTLAVFPVGQFVGSPILGALSDAHGRKQLLSGSLLVAGICNLMSGLAIAQQHLVWLIVSRLVAGLMEGNIAIARAMAADMKTLSKHETFGKINAFVSIAYLIGPFAGGVMSDQSLMQGLTTSTPFYFICILFFILAGLSALVLKKSVVNPNQEVKTFWERMNFIKRASVLFTNQRLKFLILTSTFFTLAVDIFYEFGPVYLTVKWTLGPAQLIYYNGALCLALAIGNGLLPTFISARVHPRRSILCALGGFGLFVIGMLVTNTPWLMMFWCFASGLVIGLAVTLLTVKISDSVSDAIQGEVMGLQISLRVLGDGLICLFGGLLLVLSSKLILMIAAGISLLAMVYYALRDKKVYHE
ncbi:MAG: MFS transporter [Verrucomicrobia bacterium]|nr:MFS transporter [Verrucomicrobiota bacterium]